MWLNFFHSYKIFSQLWLFFKATAESGCERKQSASCDRDRFSGFSLHREKILLNPNLVKITNFYEELLVFIV